ncbi:MAG: hypothetical protein IJU81_01250 [Bacteroidales bacterium]|nr:hypothetical protein [Bacteroidales bacterium]
MSLVIKKYIFLLSLCTLFAATLSAQDNPSKRERKKNLVVKEWNTKVGSKTPYLDNMVTYDGQGRKIEEIEYASYGQRKRTVYEYEGTSSRCSRQIEYDDKNKPVRIRKFEYNADGTKAKQYNYKPDGKLVSTKTFEYSYR